MRRTIIVLLLSGPVLVACSDFSDIPLPPSQNAPAFAIDWGER